MFASNLIPWVTVLLILSVQAQQLITPTHAPGVCAIYGNCGKKSLFGSELPCPANVEASEPDKDTRDELVELCGRDFAEGPVCCNLDQVRDMKKSLKKAENIISSCPACKDNFYQFFCRFSCSPDQSLFVNVTSIGTSTSGKDIVTELDHFAGETFASGFYDSCKDVKFGATNGYAMDLIGGGAKNYKEFLKFLGDQKPLLGGSPFQMNFPWDDVPEIVKPNDGKFHRCCDEGDFKCACADCPESCTELPEVPENNICRVGIFPCFSAAVILIYLVSIGGYLSLLLWQSRTAWNLQTRRLLSAEPDEDDEEDDFGRRPIFSLPPVAPAPGPYSFNRFLQNWCSRLASVCTSFPAATLSVGFLFVLIASLGLFRFTLETNPIRLWVSPGSREFQEKTFFDENFGPFYRAEQVYLVNDTGPVLSYETLEWWFDVEKRVAELISSSSISLEDLCLQPTNQGCVIQSLTQYFGGDIARLRPNTWQRQIQSCAASPVNCLPPFQQPILPEMVFGGYHGNPLLSRAIVATWVLTNEEENSAHNRDAVEWEFSLEDLLVEVSDEAAERGLRVSFNTEISVERELNKSTNTDARIVALSYLAMFIYASLALGGTPGISRQAFVRTKFALGLFGVLLVVMSVVSAVGIFSLLGFSVTLIIAEVIPFLILAVGVDNIFLLTHELDSVNLSHPNENVEERVTRAVGRIGPSILLSACCETVTFALGASVAMPAVRNFAICAAGAVFINALLQLTMFIAAITLDQKRIAANRMDCFPVLKIPRKQDMARESFSSFGARALASPGVFDKFSEPTISKLVRKYYAPYVLSPAVRPIIITVFVAWLAASLALFPAVELGLDQSLAMPQDSHLVSYFDDLYKYFDSGPPVYFVTREFNSTSRHGQQALCGRFTTCEEFSLANVLEQERKRSMISYIHDPAASWIDDFLQWLNPALDECCRYKRGTNHTEACAPFAPARTCEVCFADHDPEWKFTMQGMPEGPEFLKLLDMWLQSPPDPCPLGGKAAYSSSVVPDYDAVTIHASSFRSAHTPLRSQRDFINAYSFARRIAEGINRDMGVDTFAYSPFYIFFAQYITIVRDTATTISIALALILALSFIFLGSFLAALTVTGTVAMIVCDVIGAMAVWGITLNAVSLVNLTICVGLGVEFCIHIARAFVFDHETTSSSIRSRVLRSSDALIGVGGSVFGGIVLTKLIGVLVLAFTRSKIFEVFYFRMWFCLVIIASAHALVFLPVALSFIGGRGYILDEDLGLAGDLASRLGGPGYEPIDQQCGSDSD